MMPDCECCGQLWGAEPCLDADGESVLLCEECAASLRTDRDAHNHQRSAQIIDGSYPGLSNEPRWIEDDHADSYSDEDDE